MESFRSSLPIFSAREALIREFKANDCCVVVGETGTGKTTQIPQYLLEAGVNKKLAVACTQPRRVAAISIATRVAEERRTRLGQEVGYRVRFDDCSSARTRLKYMTDGMLLQEAVADPMMMRYSVVVLDEAHERTVNTDVLFGVVKAAQRERKERQLKRLRVIVMSATLAADPFSRYFNRAKILYIQGRQHPVQVYYAVRPQSDYLHSAITTVLQVHEEQPQGDILVFLTGREEIESVQRILNNCRKLFPSDWDDILVCPLFAALPTKMQRRVFRSTPKGCRKVVLATNIAETSITIPGVKYVVDTGLVKAKAYNPNIGMDVLCVVPVSKAQVYQRTGRAGRQAPGVSYRLYTEESFEKLENETTPEIQRSHLTGVVLHLLALGIQDILTFDFMDPPSEEALVTALEQLYLLGAIRREPDGKIVLTPLGEQMSHFPLEPQLSRAILASQEFGCTSEVISIIAMLSVESVFYSPEGKRETAEASWSKFSSQEGDHLVLLSVYKAYKSISNSDVSRWCNQNFIHWRNMKTVLEVRSQLQDLCARQGIRPSAQCPETETVRRCLLGGLFTNVAEHMRDGKYRTLSMHQEVHIHPSSVLFHCRPRPSCLLYTELVQTSKCYMRGVSVIDSDWLMETAPQYFKRSSSTSNGVEGHET